MKFCPICKTSYDEEVLLFCTKDGTPLIEEGEPNFTALPSESDLDEETVIRRKNPPPVLSNVEPVPDFDAEAERNSSPRIVIPMTGESELEEEPKKEAVRAMTTESIRRQPLPRKSNTPMVVFLTVLGTIVILAGGAGVFWFLSNRNSSGANQNVNYNTNFNSIDINLNANSNISNSLADFNYDTNVNTNSNTNSNSSTNSNISLNVNLRTPTPTPVRTPAPTPTATPATDDDENDNDAINTNSGGLSPSNIRPATPRPSPTATPPAPPSNRPVNAGILNSRAVNLPKPAYPQIARQMRAVGQVTVQVLLDEEGNVTSAKATSGNLLLRLPSEAAARQSKFNPVKVGNQAVKSSGIVLYNFVNQ
jgi:TonB family protein